MAMKDYLAGEVTQDFADGIVSRREAMRRLGLLGLGATAAAVLAACGGGGDDDGAASEKRTNESTSTSTSKTGAGADADGEAKLVTFRGPSGDVKGAFAAAGDPKASVLVIHENRGLT